MTDLYVSGDTQLKLHVTIHLPCGATATFDDQSTSFAYRCNRCFAVVGSMGQPSECQNEANQYKVLEELGGGFWDYITGKFVTKQRVK